MPRSTTKMKRIEIFFSVLLIPIDYLAIVLAGLSAYFIRFGTFYTDIRPVIFDLPLRDYVSILLVVGLIWIPIFALAGLYAMRGTRRAIDEVMRVSFAATSGVMLIVLIIFFRRELFSSRFIVVVGWLLAILFVTLFRLIVREVQHAFFKRGAGVHRVILIGSGDIAKALVRTISTRHHFGYSIVEHITAIDIERIASTVRHTPIDDIILADAHFNDTERMRVLQFCQTHNLGFYYAADLFNALTHNVDVHHIAGIPIIEIKRTPLDGWGKVIKRSFDVIVSGTLFIVTLPLFIAAALAVSISSRGPIIYRNTRVGNNGTFDVLKFRTMYWKYCTDKENPEHKDALAFERKLIRERSVREGPLYKIRNDPRVTPIGRILRTTSLDEMPQLLNVLFGSMSLVGPRPHQPREVELYDEHAKKILSIKPGITGLAQVSGRSDLQFDEEATLDLYYIENWSLNLDLAILMKTPLAIVRERVAE